MTITGVNGVYHGFAMSNSDPIQYYVTHFTEGKVFVFDEDWNYFSNMSSFTSVYYMIPLDNYFYMTGIWKTDEQLNVLIRCNSTATSYGYPGLYFN